MNDQDVFVMVGRVAAALDACGVEQAGAEANTQQLRDVLEVIRRQGARLDANYLDTWAAKLGIAALLARARSSAS